jgi:hypothetical protein
MKKILLVALFVLLAPFQTHAQTVDYEEIKAQIIAILYQQIAILQAQITELKEQQMANEEPEVVVEEPVLGAVEEVLPTITINSQDDRISFKVSGEFDRAKITVLNTDGELIAETGWDKKSTRNGETAYFIDLESLPSDTYSWKVYTKVGNAETVQEGDEVI